MLMKVEGVERNDGGCKQKAVMAPVIHHFGHDLLIWEDPSGYCGNATRRSQMFCILTTMIMLLPM